MPKVLLIRFSSIGDIVLTTPVVRCIKQQLGAEVHYVTKKAFQSIIDSNPYIDKAFYLEQNLSDLLIRLKAEQYDYIIDLHNNLRSLRLRQALKATSSSFDKLNLRKWLLVNLKIDTLPNIHIVDRYLEAAAFLGVKNDNRGLDFFIPAKDRVDLSLLPASFREGYTAFAIGAQHATKRLPVEKITAICLRAGTPVVLLGGKEDRENGNRVAEACGDKVYNACGLFSLNQSASLLQQAGSVISHDTGLMHIAAALGKHIVSVWGNTVPGFGMYPYLPARSSEGRIVEVKGLSCRPCSKIGHSRCPKGHFKCMNLISEEEITASLRHHPNSGSLE
jgi:ADP-heptose:LPS heptosyltransferase